MTAPDRTTISNFLGGGQAGCNWQTGTVVYGLEGDFDYFHGNENFYNNTNPLPDQHELLRHRAIADDRIIWRRCDRGSASPPTAISPTSPAALPSPTRLTRKAIRRQRPAGAGSATASKFLTGWAAGVGWEYAWTDHWMFRFEYLFSEFPKTSASGVITGPGGSNPLSGSATLVMQVARAGLNFKF